MITHILSNLFGLKSNILQLMNILKISLELFNKKIETPEIKKVVFLPENNHTSLSNIDNLGIDKLGLVKHFSPSTEEWNNSIYAYNKNELIKWIPDIDTSVYNLLKSYFNMNLRKKKITLQKRTLKKLLGRPKIRLLSAKKLFISKPRIKHTNHKVNISIYVYNRKKLFFINKLAKLTKLYKIYNLKKLLKKIRSNKRIFKLKKKGLKKQISKNKIFFKIKLMKKVLKKRNKKIKNKIKNISIKNLIFYLKYFRHMDNDGKNSMNKNFFLFWNQYKKVKLLKSRYSFKELNKTKEYKIIKKLVKQIFLYKIYISLLYFNSYLFNTYNLLSLKDIIKKIYSKKIELNIINLKYLYLDSNIFAEAITIKLKDRKKRVLRVLKLGLKLTKKPFFKIHLHRDNKENLYLFHMFKDKNFNVNINFLDKSIIKNKYLINKPNIHKTRLVLYHMRQKIVSGLRIEGSGRLTKRLTASRSISKYKYMGSLKNLSSSYVGLSTIMLRGFAKSNLQYVNINSHNRNGSFGVKVSVSVY